MTFATQIEALLFAADQPLSMARLCEVLEPVERAAVEAALHELEAAYAAPERACVLLQVAGGWQLATKPEHAPLVRRLFTGKRRLRLTKAALESLAIIAYKQPTTRPEIDAIRGVASSGVLETLLERNLVRIAGRSEGIGRPLLYATTPEFLQYLGLNRLADLPSLEELEALLAERESAARLADEEEMRGLAAAARDEPSPEGVVLEPAPGPAARLETELRERALPTLDELDLELRDRTARVAELSAQVAAARARHASESGPEAAPATSPDTTLPEGAPTEPAPGTTGPCD